MYKIYIYSIYFLTYFLNSSSFSIAFNSSTVAFLRTTCSSSHAKNSHSATASFICALTKKNYFCWMNEKGGMGAGWKSKKKGEEARVHKKCLNWKIYAHHWSSMAIPFGHLSITTKSIARQKAKQSFIIRRSDQWSGIREKKICTPWRAFDSWKIFDF